MTATQTDQAAKTTVHAEAAPDAPRRRAPGPEAELDIKCMGLTKVFRDFWLRNRVRAVEGLDLEVRRGEVFGLLGPNGSGKSTTIKMILGLLSPTAGRIAVFGKHPEHVDTKKLIGYLPEESYLYRFLNARETLDYYGRLFHQNRQQRRKRIDQLLEMVGLEAVARRPIGEYSKGMQRRIGLAQALINDPQLLILDEPTTGMDPIGTRQIKDLILRLAARGKTILLCSHLLSDVEDVCDRVAIMYGGKLRNQGTCDELLTRGELMNLQTPVLDDGIIEEIEQVLRKHNKGLEKVEVPRQRLESLFLEIVEKAQAEGVHTHGARSGGRVAGFLNEDQATPEAQAAAVIDQLTAQEQPAAATPAPLDAVTEDTQPEDEGLIGDLVGSHDEPEPPAPPAPVAADTAAVDNEDTDADLSLIDGLVTGAAGPDPQAPAEVPADTAPAPKAAKARTPDIAAKPAADERAPDVQEADPDRASGLSQMVDEAYFQSMEEEVAGGQDQGRSTSGRPSEDLREQPDEGMRNTIDELVDRGDGDSAQNRK